MLEKLLNDFFNQKCKILSYFGIDDNIIDNNNLHINVAIGDEWWGIKDNQLYFAEEKEDLLNGDGYCFGDGPDEEVFYKTRRDGIVALILGCGEHQIAELWFLREDRDLS